MKLTTRKLAGAVAVSAVIFAGLRADDRPGWRISLGRFAVGAIRNDPLGGSIDGFGRVQYRHYYAGIWRNDSNRSDLLFGFRKFAGSVYFHRGPDVQLFW